MASFKQIQDEYHFSERHQQTVGGYKASSLPVYSNTMKSLLNEARMNVACVPERQCMQPFRFDNSIIISEITARSNTASSFVVPLAGLTYHLTENYRETGNIWRF